MFAQRPWRRLGPLAVRDRRPIADGGFTLIELLVAMTIFAILAVAVGLGLAGAESAKANNRQRVVAASIMSQTLDSAQATPFASVESLNGRSTTQTLAGTTFTITEKILPVTAPSSAGGTCSFTGAGTDGEYLVVNATVSWPSMVSPVAGQIELSPPANVISAGYANETVQVIGANGSAVAGATMAVIGSTGQRATSDANGCAFLPDLLPGSAYTVQSTNGLIDQSQAHQGSGGASLITPSLAANAANSDTAVWDKPASVTTTAVVPSGDVGPTTCTEGGSTCAGFHATPLSFSANLQALQAVGGNAADTLTGLTSSTFVFPFTSGWRSWVGDCSGSDPKSASAVVATTPATPVTASAPLFTATLTSAAALSSTAVTATYVPPAGGDTGCPSGETFGYVVPSGAQSFQLALPWGTWRVSATTGATTVTAQVTMAATAVAGTLQ